MGDVLGHAVDPRQAFEITPPGRRHGGGIAQILLVELLEVGGVAGRERRRTP
jgi:hypothetical protein